MNKKLAILLTALISPLVLSSCDKNENEIVVAEVTRSIFYAPFYVAINNGYFNEEGLDVTVITTPGSDKTMSALLSKEASIGLMGPETNLYVYNNGQEDYAISFAQLTQKDGSFLVSREKIENFTLDDLKGKYVIGGRLGGMPEMTFEWALKEHGINPKTDLTIDTSIAFAAMGGAFIGGIGDFVTLFELNVTKKRD